MARLTLHVDLELVRAAEVAQEHGVLAGDWNRYLLRDPDGSGRYEEGELLWDSSRQADLSALGDLATARSAIERLAADMRSFVDTTGWARIAARIRAARAGGRAVVITLRAAAHELYTLPWEFLDMAGSPLYETGDCLLRYVYPREAPPSQTGPPVTPQRPPSSSRVLVAWHGGVPIGEHVTAIAAAARAGHVPFDAGRDVLADASRASLERALGHAPVAILHLLCHGEALPGGEGFGLRLAGGRAPVSPDEMRALLAPHARTLRLVVLAACLGGSPGAIQNELGSVAQAIHAAGVPAVVASRYPLTLPGSTELTRVLYQRLWVDHASLEDAFLAARAALRSRPRGPGEPHGVDAMAVQLHGGEAPALDFRPWIFRPYRGLSAYQREDASLFFGREDDRQALLESMAGVLASQAPRFLLVAGASGTGKSSLVRAGLVPDLEAGKLGPGPAWTSAFLRPGEGEAPGAVLADCLDRHRPGGSRGGRLVLVVDQLEEIFTEVEDDAQREAFLRALWQLACEPAGDVFVIATIRIEYMGRLGSVRMDDSGVPFDREMLAAGRYHLLRQLGPREYERIIRGPAEAVGIELEPGLLDRLLDALRTEPGALPLLSYTLDRLWQERRFQTVDIEHPAAPGERTPVTGWWLTDAAYQALGGIAGALVRSADELLATFDAAHEDELRRVLVQLVHGHDNPMLATRRRGWRDAMRPDPVSEPGAARVYDRVLDALIEARLVVTGSAAPGAPVWIELAHDSLVHAWPRLREWHGEARTWLAHTGELIAAATAWQPHARDRDAPEAREREEPYLLRGQRLGYQLEAWQRHRHYLGARDRQLVQAFLDACQRAEAETRAREIEAERQAALAEERAVAARDAAIMSAARKLLTAGQPAWATRLLGEVARPLQTRDWLSLAWDQLGMTPLASTLRGHDNRVRTAELSPDGTLVLTTSADGTARIWRADGRGEPMILRGHEGAVSSAVFSPDGTLVLTASEDCTARIWRVDGAGEPRVFAGHEDVIFDAAFSPDGQRFVTASQDRTARVWRLDRPRQSKALRGHEDSVFWVSFGADGRHVITTSGDGTARIWLVDGRASRARPAVLRHPDPDRIGVGIVSAKLSRDGRHAVTRASRDTTVQIWPLADLEHPIVIGHEEEIESMDVSPDGTLVVTAAGRTARVWDMERPAQPAIEYLHPGKVRLAAFSPDGKLVITASADAMSPSSTVKVPRRTARVWPVDPLRRDALPRVLSGHGDDIVAAAFSADGAYLVTASEDRTARIWRVRDDLAPFEILHGQTGERIFAAAFRPTGLLLAATTNPDRRAPQVRAMAPGPDGTSRPVIRLDRTLRFWRADAPDARSVLAHHDGGVRAVAFSPDGRLVATGCDDHTTRIWPLDGVDPGACTVLAGHEGQISSVSFSDDGTLVVTTSWDGTARVWPVENPAAVTVLAGHERGVAAAAFSPDGKLLVTGSSDGTARAWRLDEPREVTVFGDHTNPLLTVQISQDARHLLTLCSDSTARVFRLHAGADTPLLVDERHVEAAAFSPDGKLVVTASGNGTARIRRLDDPDRLIVLEGHERRIKAAAFSPDGKLVVTTSDDQTARVWLVADPDQFMVLRLGRAVQSAQFSPDSSRVLTIAGDGRAWLFRIDVETLRARLRSATTDCLPPDMRQRYLGETAAEARQRHEECERSHGRTPVSG